MQHVKKYCNVRYLYVSGGIWALEETWFMFMNLLGCSHVCYVRAFASKQCPKFILFLTCNGNTNSKIYSSVEKRSNIAIKLPSAIICESALPSAATFLAISRSSPVQPLPHQMKTTVGENKMKTSLELREEAFSGTCKHFWLLSFRLFILTRFWFSKMYLNSLSVVSGITANLENVSVSQNIIFFTFLGLERRSPSTRVNN